MNWLNFLRNPAPYFKKLLIELGADFYLDKNDRRILEGKVLPWVAESAQFQRILFVGCEWYTRGYRRFFKKRNIGPWNLTLLFVNMAPRIILRTNCRMLLAISSQAISTRFLLRPHRIWDQRSNSARPGYSGMRWAITSQWTVSSGLG